MVIRSLIVIKRNKMNVKVDINGNKFYYNEISRNEVKTTKSGAQLMTYDKTVLTEYANRLSHIKNSIKNQQLYQLDHILSSATILLNDLKKEYEVK